MEIVTLILWLLLLLVITGLLSKYLPDIFPLPLLQIVVGIISYYYHDSPKIILNPEVFMALLIPPILFIDSWKLPNREFFQLKFPILGLAFGLTVVNIIVGGYLIHTWLINIPIAVSFALAAILSPTDVVAVLAITKRLPLPSTTQHLLAGEALINDASSLIALKFAVTAAITGHFCWYQAVEQFLLVALGGVILGCGLAYSFNWLHPALLKQKVYIDGRLTLLLFLLQPFISFHLAEHYGLSGVLSVVSTGMLLSQLKNSQIYSATIRLQARSFWSFLEFTLNGIIFLLLGIQLPLIIQQIVSSSSISTTDSVLYPIKAIAGITVMLLLLRLAWLILSSLLVRWLSPATKATQQMNWPQIIITSFSGIRGALTLSAALSLPLLLSDGVPFPVREQLIIIALGVILLTLLLGTLIIPGCVPLYSSTANSAEQLEKQQARQTILDALLHQIELEQRQYIHQFAQHHPQTVANFTAACEGLKLIYSQATFSDNWLVKKQVLNRQLYRLQRRALQAAYQALYQLHRQNKINDTTLQHLESELDLQTATLERQT
ncbi:MAG: Na+/H+ antiporter [Candidatus Symbiodolus clandestinus]